MIDRCTRHGRRGHHGHDRGMRGYQGRAGRGDIRAAILALLAEQPMHGYQIMRELRDRSGGAWRVSPGSVYPTLSQLEDEELIQAEQQGGKRVFSLTESGTTEAAAAPSEPWAEVASDVPPAIVELRDLIYQVRAATRQVVHAGIRPAAYRCRRAPARDAKAAVQAAGRGRVRELVRRLGVRPHA